MTGHGTGLSFPARLALAVLLALALCAAAQARQWPRPPAWWIAQAACIHRFEIGRADLSAKGAWPLLWGDRANTRYRGGLQFAYGTWAAHGGRGDPAGASRGEQLYRAWLAWRADGGSWREWPNTSRACGLR